MIRLLKKRAKNVLNYEPSAEEGSFKAFHYFLSDFFVCLTPEAVKSVCIRQHKKFAKGFIVRELLDPILAPSLFSLDGDRWVFRRRFFNEWYSDAIVQKTLRMFSERLEHEFSNPPTDQPVNIADWSRKVVIETFGQSMLGVDRHVIKELRQAKTFANIYIIRLVAGLIRLYGVRRLLYIFQLSRLQLLAQNIYKQDNVASDSFVSYIRKKVSDGALPEKEAISDIATFLTFSLTTSNTLSILIYHMIENRSVWDSLNSRDDYINFCMESMRLQPTIYVLFRQAIEDVAMPGCPINKGGHVIIPVETMQNSEKNWDDAKSFCPGRFASIGPGELTDKAYYPFGIGPRQCPGKIFALGLLSSFLESVKKHKIQFEKGHIWPPPFDRGLVLEPEHNEMWVRFGKSD